MPRRIWLIGGTQESVEIAHALARANFPTTVTVTTTNAQTLYPQIPCLKVQVKKPDSIPWSTFIAQEKIIAIVDASHPYAVQISQKAISISTANNIPYLRYERSTLTHQGENVINLDSFATLVAGDYLLGQRVLLTVGYKTLPLFQPWQNRSTLFARILPVVNSLEVALACGFTPERLIALRPPISFELERALWRQWEISLVVTKASGKEGGEAIKLSVAQDLGIPLIIINRPLVVYPQQTSNLSEVVTFCSQVLELNLNV